MVTEQVGVQFRQSYIPWSTMEQPVATLHGTTHGIVYG